MRQTWSVSSFVSAVSNSEAAGYQTDVEGSSCDI